MSTLQNKLQATRMIDAEVAFHISLNVSSLVESVEFYSRVFGVAPAKLRGDYAKFEIESPPLVLSLEPHPPKSNGALNHVGIRVKSGETLQRLKDGIRARGIDCDDEAHVECCYSTQTKFWLHSPDGVLWEFYTLGEDIEHRGVGQVAELGGGQETAHISCYTQDSSKNLVHHLGGSPAETLEASPESIDQIDLLGTFNATVETGEILKHCLKLLRPGGVIRMHVLTATQPLKLEQRLPGPASVVEQVPGERELLAELVAIGFVDASLDQLASAPCFVINGVECRQTWASARKRMAPETSNVEMIYLGPWALLQDDSGTVYHRGERFRTDRTQSQHLLDLFPGRFVCLTPPSGRSCQ